MTPPGTGKKVGLGPTGETVRENVIRLRAGTQYKELSEKLTELGRPIPPLGLRRIEAGERRVDADDLMALAVALGVTPNALLLPHIKVTESIDITGALSVPFSRAWNWAEGARTLHPTDKETSIRFFVASTPVTDVGKPIEESISDGETAAATATIATYLSNDGSATREQAEDAEKYLHSPRESLLNGDD